MDVPVCSYSFIKVHFGEGLWGVSASPLVLRVSLVLLGLPFRSSHVCVPPLSSRGSTCCPLQSGASWWCAPTTFTMSNELGAHESAGRLNLGSAFGACLCPASHVLLGSPFVPLKVP